MPKKVISNSNRCNYSTFVSSIQQLLESARRQTARCVNAILTATYWEIGRRIVKYEQKGNKRAEYGEELVRSLSTDLTARLGRGFGFSQVKMMRQFYTVYPKGPIGQSVIGQSDRKEKNQSPIGQLSRLKYFPLSWTHYVQLLAVPNSNARSFYEKEALRGGWPVRQLSRQINSQFYERTLLSRHKTEMLRKGQVKQSGDFVTVDEEIKDPYVLEFLNLKDEYSESELEEALIKHLESFLLELGEDFTFVSRQKRLRLGDEWYRVDLVFYHRRLRCLVLIDLKIGKFTHADAGQMHMYLNYARHHWTRTDENPPVGLVLCAQKNEMVAKYALEGLPNKILAAEYKTALPDTRQLEAELTRTQKKIKTFACKSRL